MRVLMRMSYIMKFLVLVDRVCSTQQVNEGEEPHMCAVREVFEETGFDMAALLSPKDFIERQVMDRLVRLYLVVGVPRDTAFSPRTRKEIKAIEWFSIADLPSHKRDQAPRATLGLNANAFFMVMPFVKPLRKWIFSNRQRRIHPPPPQQGCTTAANGAARLGITDTEKLKQKQQQYFASLYQNDLAEMLRGREESTQTPTEGQRAGAVQSGSAVRSPRRGGSRKNIVPAFSSLAWTKFVLDRQALMACLQC